MKFAPLIFVVFLTLCRLSADAAPNPATENQPVPSGPLLNRAPSFSKWLITFDYLKGERASGTHPRLKSLAVTKTKHIYFEQKIYSNGSIHESWQIGKLHIVVDSQPHRVNIYESGSFGEGIMDPSLYTDYSSTDFPGVEWVSMQTFLGIQKGFGGEKLLFRKTIQPPLPELGRNPVVLTVCIDEQTRLPVQVQSEEAILNYQYLPPPETLLVLPPDVQRLLDRRAATIKTLTTTTPSF